MTSLLPAAGRPIKMMMGKVFDILDLTATLPFCLLKPIPVLMDDEVIEALPENIQSAARVADMSLQGLDRSVTVNGVLESRRLDS